MTAPPSWSRALLLDAFSERRVAVAAPVALLSVLALRASVSPAGDTDAWWIAAAGRELLARGAVPRENLWSAADPHRPWVFHEWLVSPLYAWGCASQGARFVALLGVLGGCATSSALLLALRRGRVRDDTAAWTVFAALLALQASAVSPRPGYALLALPLVTLALTRAPRWTLAHAVAAVALTVAWTNAHGSFPVGLALLAAGALRAERPDRAARLGTVAAASLATIANPYGTSLHSLVLRYLRGGDPMAAVLRAEVLEFRPLWTWPEPFANGWVVACCAGLAVLAARSLRRGSRADRVDAALALALVAMGVMQSRHLALAAVLGLALLAPALDALRPARAAWTLPRAPLLLALPLAIALAVIPTRPRDHVSDALGGRDLAALAVAPSRAWAPFDATGWLLWRARARGDARLLFDARNDCHPAEAARDALRIERGELQGGALCAALDRWSLDAVYAPTEHPAARGASRCAGWREEARAGAWSRAARVGQRAVSGQTSPVSGLR